MVKCSYCDKEFERLVFCKPSHKVMYHQRKTLPKVNTVKTVEELKIPKPKAEWGLKLCKHGRPPNLCTDFSCRRI